MKKSRLVIPSKGNRIKVARTALRTLNNQKLRIIRMRTHGIGKLALVIIMRLVLNKIERFETD